MCGTSLPSSLARYQTAVIARYKKVDCQLGATNKAFVNEQDQAIITFHTTQHMRDPEIVAHEMMHLWLGTRGWNLSERFVMPTAPSLPEGGDLALRETFSALEEYIEHRMFVPVLHRSGLSGKKEVNALLLLEEKREGLSSPFPVALLAGVYLGVRLEDREMGQNYAQFLRRTGRGRSLKAAELLSAVIEQEDPRTQEAALQAERDCFLKVFAVGSPFLELTP